MQVIYKILAIGFPAGYRFLAVNLIAHFAAANVSDFFAQSFFMISLLATFSGFAVASQSYVAFRNLSLPRRLLLVVVLLAAFSVPCYLLWHDGFESYVIVWVAAMGYSVFEITRSDLAVKGRFKLLSIQGCVAVSFLGISLYLWHDSPFSLVISMFWTLAFAAVVLGSQKMFGGDSLSFDVYKDVASYSISNGLSTGLMFVIPMLLIAEFGKGAATNLAQIVTLSTVFLLYPRYLSAGFMIELQSKQNWEMARVFEKKVLTYVVLVCSVFALAVFAMFDALASSLLLFVAIQCSQLGLPHANVHSVLGRGARMLEVNAKSLFLFIVCALAIYWIFEKGQHRADALVALYLMYILLRTVMTRASCRKLLLV